MDRRFAIVIGINDYQSNPLMYCVSDAKAVAALLETKCNYQSGDIHLITSDSTNPVKDISGHLDMAIKDIAKELKPNTDSIFFYFASHGEYHFDKSCLVFHDSMKEIADVFNQINDLNPKYQCYVIDACESGGKVLSRGVSAQPALLDKFVSKSKGILLMYAATEDETAMEYDKIKHGLFTYYFLMAINNDALYDDGILTPNRIQDFIARETLKESRFKQTPVIENRTVGYYPFAFKSIPVSSTQPTTLVIPTTSPSNNSSRMVDKEYFPQVPPEIRDSLFPEIIKQVGEAIDALQELQLPGYTISIGSDLSVFDNDIDSKLTNSIVGTARNEDVAAFGNIFATVKRDSNLSNLFGNSMIDSFLFRNRSEPSHYNTIYWSSGHAVGFSFFLKAENVYKVSSGFTIFIYQAVFGIGFGKTSFYLDFDGLNESIVKGPYTRIRPFKVNGEIIPKILEEVTIEVNKFKEDMSKWNDRRQKAIAAFDRKSK